jgi:lysophospholipase L1-like esterase
MDVWNVAATTSARDNDVTPRAIAAWDSQDGTTTRVTQSTAASQPYFVGGNRASPFPRIEFNPSAISGGNPGLGTASGYTLGNRSQTALFVIEMPHWQEVMASIKGQGASGTIGGVGIRLGRPFALFAGSAPAFTGSDCSPNIQIPTNRQIMVARWGDGSTDPNFTVYTGLRRSAAATLDASNGTSATMAFGAVGSGATNASFQGAMFQAVLANARWTDAEVADAINYAAGLWDIDPDPDYNFVIIGDSLSSSGPTTGGSGGITMLNNQTWVRIFSNMLDGGGRHSLYNRATSSLTCDTANSEWATRGAPSFVAGKTNIFIAWIGTNDIAGGATEAQVATRITTLCANARAAGASKIIVCNAIPRSGFNTTINAWNALLAANFRNYGADATVDLNSLFFATQGYATPTLNPQWYITADQTHITPEAMGVVASEVLKVVRPFVTSRGGAIRPVASFF